MASVATIDKTAAAATTVVDGTFNSTTDWAVVAVEIRPRPAAEQAALASRQDAPDAAALRPPGAVTVRIHPNPFTQGTSIDCELPTEGHADASVYSVRGQRVRTLASGRRAAGSWPLHWDGRSDRRDGLGAGIYFLHLRIAGVDHQYKLVLLKWGRGLRDHRRLMHFAMQDPAGLYSARCAATRQVQYHRRGRSYLQWRAPAR